ncbi:hypothetical protein DPEC_G00136150 [Dallia pectoralis]|uniref:Uncharacterized protein n=1 Tax=Dallia pectoralis TaxID=75939 RepID=A0ACC2GLR1_DALPE|nr:hypothetical protein DPEC_G00136150 [Dallia pectoralis]
MFVDCFSDGLFGQCRTSKQDHVKYQVSVPVLKRMQEVLKQLMLQGLSWQDDITQYIVAKELSRVPHTTRTSKDSLSPHSKQTSSKTGGYLGNTKDGTTLPDDYEDPIIVESPQAPFRMQTPMDPYTYQQHMYQEEVERSLHPGAVYPGPRPSSRYQQAKQRARDRQLLQDAISLYMSAAPAQSSFHHRGAASLPASPYFEDLDLPLDYSLAEQNRDRQQLQQQLIMKHQQLQSEQQHQQRVPQEHGSPAVLDESILQRMADTLERYGVNPKDLTPQQLYRLALVLELMQAENQEKTDPYRTDVVAVKETQQVLKSGDKVSLEALTQAPAATNPPQTTATRGASMSTKSPVVPAQEVEEKEEEKEKAFKIPVVLPAAKEGTVAKEEYGYIVTNQSPLSLYDGVRLLELLAERIHLTTSSFINISVVGPALTFRIRQNTLNMSAEEVADKAVSEKNFLESETGLKILQTGVGEVNNL